ncbi:nucleolar protein 4-like isoform X2 [Dunckerocampus dactyliophorus]|uniref:nucleolar protein 4-like isoform X2 n=1 Tax=Dunckerocampus dactyliophorus TaxID=161453 RepID=UPI002406B8A4|nr:nucleolar protein 4-like isoform X2 [Dunckerocampus dactyliophorus]
MATKKACVDAPKRSRSPVVLEAEMFSEFQDWCLRTYGDSGKTKTVTRRKYNKIMQTLLQNDESDGVYVDNSHINAKFKFWVKSKGFQVGTNVLGEHNKKGAPGKPVLYVPVKSTCSDGHSAQDNSSLKRVAVVEDFFDIIYAMHVEIGADPGRAPKHAGQKKTYKAIAETYAFLPREAVTRFLMSCGECQKRMHINPSTAEFKENDRPTSLVPDLIDYNMPLTATYLKQMKLQCMTATERDDSSVSSEDMNGAEPAWVAAEQPPVPEPSLPNGERLSDPAATIKEEDDDDSSQGSSANGMPALTSSEVQPVGGNPPEGSALYGDVTENGLSAPLDFSTTLSSSSPDDQQPVNLSDRLLPAGCSPQNSYPADPNRKYPIKTEYSNKSPPYSSGSYDSVKTELSMCAEDLTSGRAQIVDDDDDDHDDHDDADKINDAEGMDPERLKAFNRFHFHRLCVCVCTTSPLPLIPILPLSPYAPHPLPAFPLFCFQLSHPSLTAAAPRHFSALHPLPPLPLSPSLSLSQMFVRLFVDENLDRMVPISKQPKEKIQAIMESCSRQFPEFQERSRKRIRTYLKSCRRMKKSGFEIRPTPPHLTSAMAENILAAACESETRNAAKRMRLDVYPTDEPISVDKPSTRDPASVAPSGFAISSTAFVQDQLYTNGGLNYNLRGYGTASSNQQNAAAAAQTNGPTDLSMKSVAPNSSSSSSNSHGQGGGGGGASAQLSPPEVTAVRQLIAGYRESAAFLLRSADELENLILQQN